MLGYIKKRIQITSGWTGILINEMTHAITFDSLCYGRQDVSALLSFRIALESLWNFTVDSWFDFLVVEKEEKISPDRCIPRKQSAKNERVPTVSCQVPFFSRKLPCRWTISRCSIDKHHLPDAQLGQTTRPITASEAHHNPELDRLGCFPSCLLWNQ